MSKMIVDYMSQLESKLLKEYKKDIDEIKK